MPGRPSLAGRSLLPVLRPTSGMGGGGSALKVCADHRGGINWLSLSPDGQRLLTGSEDGTARLWSTADGQCCALLQGHESYVTFCQLEDEAAFTCSADCTIRKWDVLTGQCLQVFRGHTSIVNRILVANNQLFSSSYDRTARAWNVDKGQVSWEFRGHRNCVLTLAYLASWDLPGAPCMEEAMAGGLLVTGSTDGTAKVWQVASGCCHQTLRGHTGAVLCLVLDTPSHTAFTGSTDATIRAWDILSGEQLRVFREHQGSVICLELVNRHVYSGSADRTVKCWLADTGERVRTFAAHGHSVSALKYHAGTWVSALLHLPYDIPVRRADRSRRGLPELTLPCPPMPQRPAASRARPRALGAGGPVAPCVHSVHGQRGRPRARLRRPVRSAAEGVPRPRLHHQLHPGARPGALHRLARWHPAPLGRARPPALPAASPRHPQAQPLAPLQQQGGLRRRRAPAADLRPTGPPPHRPRRERGPLAPRGRGGLPKPGGKAVLVPGRLPPCPPRPQPEPLGSPALSLPPRPPGTFPGSPAPRPGAPDAPRSPAFPAERNRRFEKPLSHRLLFWQIVRL
ncbi:WD repeat-containing protein 86 isoform X1 [Camelus bactrianus]|uniref:WD repeat-containing protein 86 isoform X1 n=3 Tax=Camelus bactrianus TaxID=9837 RepID=A0AC58QKN2_CAMBA